MVDTWRWCLLKKPNQGVVGSATSDAVGGTPPLVRSHGTSMLGTRTTGDNV